jgi:hypothetical protein
MGKEERGTRASVECLTGFGKRVSRVFFISDVEEKSSTLFVLKEAL